jgi:hypothetical protein
MAGEIRHEWVGTTLVITSDSGTSSCDLKGRTGDMGVRGAQGPCGVIYDQYGNIITSGFITKEEFNELIGSFGKTNTIYHKTGMHYNYVDANEEPIETNYINFDNTETVSYRFRIVYEDGTEEIIDTVLKNVSGITGTDVSDKSERLAAVLIGTDGKLAFFSINGQETDYIEELEITLTSGEEVYIPFDAQLIPVDNETIKINEQGRIYALGTGSGSGLPSVTTEDNGKFLMVVDGEWAPASVPNLEEVSF